jgi:hypothetical protein
MVFAAVRNAVTLNFVTEKFHYTEQNENALNNPNTHLCLTLTTNQTSFSNCRIYVDINTYVEITAQ